MDIDRLHWTVENINSKFSIRRFKAFGYTTAFIELMRSEVWLGDVTNRYLYVGDSRMKAEQVRRRFAILLANEEFGATLHRESAQTVSANTGQLFMFVSVSDVLKKNITGLQFNRIFVDVDLGQRKVENVDILCKELSTTLPPDGDIV